MFFFTLCANNLKIFHFMRSAEFRKEEKHGTSEKRRNKRKIDYFRLFRNNRVYVLAIASDLMWDRDEGRARALTRIDRHPYAKTSWSCWRVGTPNWRWNFCGGRAR